MKHRIGLVGCGWIAHWQVLGWQRIGNAEVVAVCDRDITRAEGLARQFGIQWHGSDAVQMMDIAGIDIVDIATPPETHKSLALAAAGRGLHILCQKPLALTVTDAEEMIEAARVRGVVLYVNEMLRFCPWYGKVRELLDNGAAGRPVYLRVFSRSAAFLETGPQRQIAYGFRDFLRSDRHGITLEETIHYFDVVRYLFGEPQSVYAAMQRVSGDLTGNDSVAAVLRYPDRIAVVEDSWGAHGPERSGLELEGTAGAIVVSHNKRVEWYSAETGTIGQSWDYGDLPWPDQRPIVFSTLFREFLRCIETGDRTAQALDNLRTLRLTLAAHESAERHAEVLL